MSEVCKGSDSGEVKDQRSKINADLDAVALEDAQLVRDGRVEADGAVLRCAIVNLECAMCSGDMTTSAENQ